LGKDAGPVAVLVPAERGYVPAIPAVGEYGSENVLTGSKLAGDVVHLILRAQVIVRPARAE